MPDNVVPLRASEPDGEKISLAEIVEDEYVQVLLDMRRAREDDERRLQESKNSDNTDSEGTSGSSQTVTVSLADRVRVLSSATEFLLKLQKLKPPEKTRSGLDSLRDQFRGGDSGGRTRRRRTGAPE